MLPLPNCFSIVETARSIALSRAGSRGRGSGSWSSLSTLVSALVSLFSVVVVAMSCLLVSWKQVRPVTAKRRWSPRHPGGSRRREPLRRSSRRTSASPANASSAARASTPPPFRAPHRHVTGEGPPFAREARAARRRLRPPPPPPPARARRRRPPPTTRSHCRADGNAPIRRSSSRNRGNGAERLRQLGPQRRQLVLADRSQELDRDVQVLDLARPLDVRAASRASSSRRRENPRLHWPGSGTATKLRTVSVIVCAYRSSAAPDPARSRRPPSARARAHPRTAWSTRASCPARTPRSRPSRPACRRRRPAGRRCR